MKLEQDSSLQKKWQQLRKRSHEPRNRDELMRLTPTPVQLFWGALGLFVGIVATVIFLLVIAPEPPAVVVLPTSSSDVAITLDDAALSNLTAAGIAQAGLPFTITNIHTHILPNNKVQITGDVPILGGIAMRRLSATAKLTAEQGHVALHVTNATVGGFDLPGFVTQAIESSFNSQSAALTNSLNVDQTKYDVSGISSSNGKLTLKLRQAP